MARRAKSKKSRKFAALQLAGLGAILIVVPWLLRQSPISGGLRPLAGLGWLFLLAGGALFWLPHKLEGTPNFQGGNRNSQTKEDVQLDANPTPDTVSARQWIAARKPSASPRGLTEPQRPSKWSSDVIRLIEWRRFEAVIEALFAQSGFVTRSQSHGADGGVDVWLHMNDVTSPAVGIVQCKGYSAKPVGVDKVREFRGVMASHQLARGHFPTSSKFSADAIAFATSNGVHLLDADGLLSPIE